MIELFDLLSAATNLGQPLAVAIVLTFLRIGAAFALLPAFGEQAVPQRIRLILAVGFTAIVAPAVEQSAQSLSLRAAGVEVIAGLALGGVFRLFILALQIAGAIIAQATSLSQITAGAAPEPQPAIGHLLTSGGLAVAVMAGLHVNLAQVLILSYEAIPIGQLPNSADVVTWGLSHITHAFSLGFSLAAPFTIAGLMYNLALGAINKAMPALMVSFIGAPALSWGGLVLLAILSPILLAVWIGAFDNFLANPFEAAR